MTGEDGSSDTYISCESPNTLASPIETSFSVDMTEFDWERLPGKILFLWKKIVPQVRAAKYHLRLPVDDFKS